MILFFDDQTLEARINFVREYGKLQYVPASTYRDPSDLSISAGLPSVFYHEELKEYVMIYNILDTNDSEDLGIYMCAAHSKDLTCWEPIDTKSLVEIPNRKFFNQAFFLNQGEGWIYEDKRAKKEERYKLFYCRYAENLRISDELYVSADLFNWTKLDCTWNTQGAEPGIGCAYSQNLKSILLPAVPIGRTDGSAP